MAAADFWDTVGQRIGASLGTEFKIEARSPIGGGCINSAYRVDGGGRCYFVKLNDAGLADMFEAEAEGLAELSETASVRVPQPVCHGVAGGQAFLVLDYISLHASRGDSDRLLGQQLAAMHRQTQSGFGWHRDNFIGSTPQPNAFDHDWPRFWRDQRLRFQLQLAADRGFGGRLQKSGESLCAGLDAFFNPYSALASLLHGDLWGGNYSADEAGQPVVFDPACYYGDREADLAMTELFGGFGADFYAAYNETWALDVGYRVRKRLYNLYHILNHLNLFGGGYLGQAESLIAELLAEIR